MPVVISGDATGTNNAIVLWQALTASVIYSTQASGYPAINVLDPATWSSWKGTGNSVNWIGYDFGTPVTLDSMAVAAHNMASSGVTSVGIQKSENGVSWSGIVAYSPLTDLDFIVMFPAQTYRYWRIVISGPASNVGVMVWGSKLSFPHTPIDSYTPLHHARKYDKMFNDSIKGAMLGNRVMASGAETEVDFGFVPRVFVDTSLLAFESHYNQGGMFFYASWPAGLPQDIGYCRTNSDDGTIQIEFIEGENLASLSFGIHAYAG